MKTPIHKSISRSYRLKLIGVTFAGALMLGIPVLHSWGKSPSSEDFNLDISRAGNDLVLSWTIPDVVLQRSQTLNGDWLDLPDASSPHTVTGNFDKSFFRLKKVSTLHAVEPAFLPTSGGIIYVRGVNFDSNSTVTINGMSAASVVFVDPSLLMVSVAALDAGTYDVAVGNGAFGPAGFTLAKSLTVENEPVASLEVPPGVMDERTASGEINLTHVDLRIDSPVGPGFVIARTHRSRHNPVGSPFGTAWDFSCNISAIQAGADVVVNDGSGRSDKFYHQSDGTFRRAEFFREGSMNGQVFTLTLADKTKWTFRAFDAAVAPGKIAAITDANGNAMTYSYGVGGRLEQITDALGRSCLLSYNGSGQLTGLADFTGRTVTYAYYGSSEPGGTEGSLKSMTSPAVTGTPNGNDFPFGKTVYYTYTKGFPDERLNHNLTGVINNSGTQIQTIAYTTELNPAHFDFDRAVSIAIGTNPPTVFSCEALSPSPANRYAKTKVTVNDPVGNVSETLYDSKNRPVSIKEMTGRAVPGMPVTAVGNQPTGKLRASDPAFFETTMAYNLDSQVKQITYPRGNSVAMTYASDLSSTTPVRERGNLRQVTQTPAPGVPSDHAQITESFEYQPGFGTAESSLVHHHFSMSGVKHGRCDHQDLTISTRGISSRVDTNFQSASEKVTQYTDPRGNVTTGTYDANGNCLSISLPGLSTGHNFEYNAVGQLTAQVSPADANGRRQRDTFSYYGSGTQKGQLQSAVEDAGAGGLSLTTTYTYDAAGNVSGIIDPRGNDTQFVFNQWDQLIRTSSPTGPGGQRVVVDRQLNCCHPMITFSLYANDPSRGLSRIDISHLDENGSPVGDGIVSTHYGYNSIGQLTSMTDAAGGVTQYEYDANGQISRVLSPLAASGAEVFNAMQYDYDERGLALREVSAPGSTAQSTTQYDYDANANLARVSEGLEGTPQITMIENDGLAYGRRCMFSHSSSTCRSNVGLANDGPVATFEGYRYGIDAHNKAKKRTNDALERAQAVLDDSTGPVTSDPGTGGFSQSPSKRFKVELGTMIDQISNHMWNGDDLSVENGGTEASMMWTGKPLSVENGGTGSTTSDTEMCGSNPSVLFRGRFMSMLSPGVRISGGTDPITASGPIGSASLNASTIPKTKLSLLGDVATPSPLAAIITDPQGNTTTFHYDANGNCSSIRMDGEVNDVPGSAGNVKLAEASFNYDALNRLTNQTALSANSDLSGMTVRYIGSSERISEVIDPNGNSSTFTYDTAGRLVTASDAKANSVSYGYDDNGNVTAVTKRLKSDLGNADLVFAKSFAYDKLNRCTSTTDNVGNMESFAYDSRGNVVRSIDARGIVSQFQYDDLSRPTRSGLDMNGNGSTLDPVDIVTVQSWDANSRLGSQTDPNGNVTSFGYDLLNRLTQTTSADGTIHSTTYDIHGNATSTTDPNGTVVSNTYDSNNRLIQRSIAPAVGVAATTTLETFSHDGMGRLTLANDNDFSVSFTYDLLGRKLTETQDGRTVTSSYDAAGNRLTVTYPGGRTIGYAYNPTNLPTTVSLLATSDGASLGVLSSTSYIGEFPERVQNRNNTRTSYTYNGVSGVANAPGDFGWAQVSRVLTINSLSSAVIDDSTYLYDAAQNQTGKTNILPGKVTAKAYQYDAADRLVNTVVTSNTVPTANISYTLDKAGNRVQVSGDNHPGAYTLNNALPEPADFQVNQYTNTPVGSFTYDKNGNRVAESIEGQTVRNFSYDHANRLTGISVPGASIAMPVAAYTYDVFGRRIRKISGNGGFSNTITYVYDSGDVIEERNGAGAVSATFVPRRQWIGVRRQWIGVRSPFTCGSLMQTRNGINHWSHNDEMGSTVALTLENGTVAERYEYADFGKPSFFNGAGGSMPSSASKNLYLWHGMLYDEGSTFYFGSGSSNTVYDSRVNSHINPNQRQDGGYSISTLETRWSVPAAKLLKKKKSRDTGQGVEMK